MQCCSWINEPWIPPRYAPGVLFCLFCYYSIKIFLFVCFVSCAFIHYFQYHSLCHQSILRLLLMERSEELVSCRGGFQVALEFSYSRFIQREQVKVKGCIGDIEIPSLFYEVYDLNRHTNTNVRITTLNLDVSKIKHLMYCQLHIYIKHFTCCKIFLSLKAISLRWRSTSSSV